MPKPILLIEDNDDDAFAFRRALKKTSCTEPLHVATDGRQAVDFLAQAAAATDPAEFPLPALVFLDLKLPYRSGMEVLEWLRGHERLRTLPVIVLSGSDEPRDRQRASELGASGYLVKPATVEDLRETLARAL